MDGRITRGRFLFNLAKRKFVTEGSNFRTRNGARHSNIEEHQLMTTPGRAISRGRPGGLFQRYVTAANAL
jgi:hypothetical protein